MQKKKGISLIVLVITIIVMIILAVSVVITLSNSGVISKSNKAITSSNDAMVRELAELAWSEAYIELSANKNLTEQNLKGKVVESLQDQGVDISKYSITVNLKGVTVESKTTAIETKAWTLTDNDSSNSITVGDLITSNKKTTEQFYVIGVEGNSVKMLAKYNLKSDGSEQDTTGENNTSEFSTTAYWANISGITYPYNLNNVTSDSATVINKAKAYGTSLEATGRLMTIEEIEDLGGDSSNYTTSFCPSFINTQEYWLASADESVWERCNLQ